LPIFHKYTTINHYLSIEVIMRNRAVCRLCNTIIESKHRNDYVTCACGEISLDGGSDSGYIRIIAKDFANCKRIDDEGNEIIFIVKDKNELDTVEPTKSKRTILIDALRTLIENMNRLPPDAMNSHVTHYDLLSVLLILEELLTDFCKEDT
jgi:hypothetical protein